MKASSFHRSQSLSSDRLFLSREVDGRTDLLVWMRALFKEHFHCDVIAKGWGTRIMYF